jgi:hypothetical protein
MENNQNSRLVWVVLGVLIALVIIGVGVYFFILSNNQTTVPAPVVSEESKNVKPSVSVSTSKFTQYKEIPVTVTPKVPAYTVNPDLSNVANASDFTLSPAAKKLLVQNAFVVIPGHEPEFFPLYEGNRYAYVPNFVTTDSLLHNYHLVFDHVLKELEEQKLVAELKKLNIQMLSEAQGQYEALKDTPWANAAKRNLGFFTVGSKLLDPTIPISPLVKTEVERELALIAAHQSIEVSPVINIGGASNSVEALKEDYSQYIPRGHYDTAPELKAYFNSMMWYGRLTFRLKNEDEIKSGMLITLALNKQANQTTWNNLYEPINFFVGKSDDITYYDFKQLLDKVYGAQATVKNVASDATKFAAFVAATKELHPPEINSIPIFNAAIQPDREKEIKGFRFVGQRFTIDAAIFQRLVDREVTGRMLPKGLDIPAALGSAEALSILTQLGETNYKNYPENLAKLQTYLTAQSTQVWTQNLYWGWLNTLRSLVGEKPAGYPSFMRNVAWVRKELNTFLGSWTELKHDTILYAKQVYAELGGGGPEKRDDRGYVEPNPQLYARLAALLNMTSTGLESRGLLNPEMKDNLDKMETLALSLKTISEKELNNSTLTDDEYELIRSYGGQLEHFWLEVNKDDPAFKASSGQRDYLNENPAALVADVATDPNGKVLEEATGRIAEIYVVAPVAGQLKIVNGGVYSYYEFTQTLSNRLTDKKWRELLTSPQAPALPAWTSAFIAK